MSAEKVYTLVCEKCCAGWPSATPEGKHSLCGEDAQLRGAYVRYDLPTTNRKKEA